MKNIGGVDAEVFLGGWLLVCLGTLSLCVIGLLFTSFRFWVGARVGAGV